jgi:DNA polymerase-4
MRSVTRSKTVPDPFSTTRALTEISLRLARTALADNSGEREITLLAISVSRLVEDTPPESLRSLDDAVDAVREKYGRAAVGTASVVLRGSGRVPDEFRELAEAPIDDGDR